MLQVTAIVYANPHWKTSDRGKLRLWPPAQHLGQCASAGAQAADLDGHAGAVPPAAAGCARPCLGLTLASVAGVPNGGHAPAAMNGGPLSHVSGLGSESGAPRVSCAACSASLLGGCQCAAASAVAALWLCRRAAEAGSVPTHVRCRLDCRIHGLGVRGGCAWLCLRRGWPRRAQV